MLRALHRLLRPNGRVAYITIYVAPGLTPAQRRRAHRSGPRAVASRAEQHRLLASAGFTSIESIDLTAEFAVTARAWLMAWDANADALIALESREGFAERQRDRRAQLRAIEDGLLWRGLFCATRPGPGGRQRP